MSTSITNYRRRDYTIRNGGGHHLRYHPSTCVDIEMNHDWRPSLDAIVSFR